MTTTSLSGGNQQQVQNVGEESREEIHDAVIRLSHWLETNDYRGYDTFDGLNAKFVRLLTFKTNFLRIVLQQGVRRFPFNLRPLLGISKERSTKGMGFLARAFLRLHKATGEPEWANKAEFALQWLIDNQSKGY